MCLFEHLLMRLEKSDYVETFVLRGGRLISSMTGIAQRTTMDMDVTVVGMDMDEGTDSEGQRAHASAAKVDGRRDRGSLRSYESGKRNPGAFERIAKALDIRKEMVADTA